MKLFLTILLTTLIEQGFSQTDYFKSIDSSGGFEGYILKEKFSNLDQFQKVQGLKNFDTLCKEMLYFYEDNHVWWNSSNDYRIFGLPIGDEVSVCLTGRKRLKEVVFILKPELIDQYHIIRKQIEALLGEPIFDPFGRTFGFKARLWIGQNISILYSLRFGYNYDHPSLQWSRDNCALLTLTVGPPPSKQRFIDIDAMNYGDKFVETDSLKLPEPNK